MMGLIRRRPSLRCLAVEGLLDGLPCIAVNDGFVLAVELEITLPNVDHDTAQALAEKAHQVCPYSNATRGNIDVLLTVTDD